MSHDPHFLRPGHGVSRSGLRKRRRKRIAIIAGFMLLVAAIGLSLLAYQFITSPSYFQVHNIIVEGTEFSEHEEIVEAVRKLTRRNVLLVDLKQVCATVEEIAWVLKAEARTILPDTLQLTVTERVPTAYVLLGNKLYLTDDSGTLIDQVRPEHPFSGLPVVHVVGGLSSGERQRRLRPATSILSELREKAPAWYARVSGLDTAEPSKMKVLLTDRSFPIIVGDENVFTRLEKYFSVEAELLPRYDTIDYIDVRFERRLYVSSGGVEDRGQAP